MAIAQTIFSIWFQLHMMIISRIMKGVDFVLETIWSGILKLTPLTSKVPIDPPSLCSWNSMPFLHGNDRIYEWAVHLVRWRDSREELKMERWDMVLRDMDQLEQATKGFMDGKDIHYGSFLNFIGLLRTTCKSVFLYALADTNYKYTLRICDVLVNNAPQTGSNHAPQTGSNHAPQTGSNHAPQTGSNHAPQTGSNHAPQTGSNHAPQTGDKPEQNGIIASGEKK